MFWGAVLIVVGLILAFLGNKFIILMIGIISALAIFVGGLYATSAIVDASTNETNVKDYVVWIILVVWAIVGMVGGWFIAKKKKLGIAIVGGFGGAMLGMLITTMFVVGNAAAYYGVIFGTAILCAIVTYFIETFVIIVVTAFIGSYFVIRGISMYAGGFPNETELHNMSKSGVMDWDHFPKVFYAYLAGIIILWVLSAVFQWKKYKKSDRD